MSKNEFEEKDPQEKEEVSVDFSDLGSLFQENPREPAAEEASPAEEGVEFEQLPQAEPAEPLSEEIPETPEDASVTFEAQEPAEASVDFSDLGPLFQEDATVQAGEAALLLKKLSEMEPVEEEPSEDPLSQDILPEEEPVTFEPDSPAEEASEKTSSNETAETEASIQEPEEISEEAPSAEEAPQEEILRETDSEAAVEEEAAEEAPAPEAAEVSEESAEAPQVEESQPEKKPYQRPTHKGRPKRKKGEGFFGIPNLLVTVVWIAITVLIGVTLGRMAWICAADVLAFGREDKPVTITVYEADTIEDITRKLHDGGLIKYPGLFKLYANLAVDEGEIHPGIWDLNTRYDYHALVNMMSPSSSREVIELMIPEGYSCRQIFALMEENKICTSLDLGAYAASGELEDYWFLDGVKRGDMYCLEGYLFPDTYQFYKNDSPRNVLTKMLDNFNSRFDETMVAKIDELNAHLANLMRKGGHGDAFIEENRFTVRDVINVASLIEKETSSADEGYVIASVIYNRLFNWPDNVPYLNIDATIVYALGGKNKLTQEDLKVNSPYNTYTHTGLTPGPIANPGLSSIRAALSPSDSNYYYYVLDPALGSHRFSTTYDEHKANIASIGD